LVVGIVQEGLEQFGDAGGVHVESDCRQHWLSGASGRRTSKQGEQSLEAGAWLVAQLTFPKAQDSNFVRAQGSCDLSISLFVAGKLPAPVRSIGLGYVAAFGAAVPETSVDEYGDALSREEKVGASAHSFGVKLPACNTIPDQVRSKAQFRGYV
jgi:hypothetical protein